MTHDPTPSKSPSATPPSAAAALRTVPGVGGVAPPGGETSAHEAAPGGGEVSAPESSAAGIDRVGEAAIATPFPHDLDHWGESQVLWQRAGDDGEAPLQESPRDLVAQLFRPVREGPLREILDREFERSYRFEGMSDLLNDIKGLLRRVVHREVEAERFDGLDSGRAVAD